MYSIVSLVLPLIIRRHNGYYNNCTQQRPRIGVPGTSIISVRRGNATASLDRVG